MSSQWKNEVIQASLVSEKLQQVWNVKVSISDLVVDLRSSVWQNSCDNYRRLYPGKYQDYLEQIVD